MQKSTDKNERIIINLYRSSMKAPFIAVTIIGILEMIMILVSYCYPDAFGIYLNSYRMMYFSLLFLSVIFVLLNRYVNEDLENRYRKLNILNPVYSVFFFAWALGVTYVDALSTGVVDPILFMTFTLTVPLSSYFKPVVYAVIVTAADIVMIIMLISFNGLGGSLINVLVFFIFQFFHSITFFRIRIKLAGRIIEEQYNARIDVMTGCRNRRVYSDELKRLSDESVPKDLVYIAVDINGLKRVNDEYGHDSGDRLIIGAAECMERCFADKGSIYRIGGDEFVVMIRTLKNEINNLFSKYESLMKSWSEENKLELCASYGYIICEDHPDRNIIEIAKMADTKMYEAKEKYYQTKKQIYNC